MKAPRILLAGSSDYSTACFEAIVQQLPGLNVTQVWTQPDRAVGRKLQLQPSPVAVWAESRSYTVHKLDSLKSPKPLELLQSIDLALVISYGAIIPATLLALPGWGWWNVHPSDLPQFRGAAPLHATILAGLEQSAVCLMLMEAGLDCGPVLARAPYAVPADATVAALERLTAPLAAELFAQAYAQALERNLSWTAQSTEDASYISKISKQDGQITLAMSANDIERRCRAYAGWPGTYFETSDGPLFLRQCRVGEPVNAPAGQIVSLAEGAVQVALADGGSLWLKRVQRAGKAEMSAADYFRGKRLSLGQQAI